VFERDGECYLNGCWGFDVNGYFCFFLYETELIVDNELLPNLFE
jgi:hypothetical protein